MHQAPTAFEVKGAAICTKRMQKGMSVGQLARLVGCTANYLRKLERGTRPRMGPEFYVRLRTALDVTDADLLNPAEE
ncbi:helix-turn-helix domain-containing protein [Streptomyces sp. NPDC059456]|uniref:helix-turn-helix domain-containing protein n=1 Tax=Streptomyces sp. NPDC059456 TaxID=3346838 RepID=UPI0036B6B6C8